MCTLIFFILYLLAAYELMSNYFDLLTDKITSSIVSYIPNLSNKKFNISRYKEKLLKTFIPQTYIT